MNFKIVLKAFMQKKSVIIFSILTLVIVIPVVLAPLIAPNNIYTQDIANKFATSSFKYPFGTDQLGRCVFSRMLYGGRATLGYSFVTVMLSSVLGIAFGIISGYLGGKIDHFIMRICDIMYAFPSTVLTLVFVAIVGRGMDKIVIAMLITQWVSFARISRGLTVKEKSRSYISAAEISGSGTLKIMIRHILPSVFPPMIALITINFGHTILSISGLSFLGLGVQPPDPEWGAMIDLGRDFIFSHPMIMFWPGIMILLIVIALNVLGDTLQETLQNTKN
ncbi:MAG: ABC transporter permease [Peptococcaceae bacterium]